jgi:uncharacterized membrane protein HdeD (DUF308 family)
VATSTDSIGTAKQRLRSPRSRGVLSAGLAVLAAAAIVLGGGCLYAREELLNANAFSDRTVAALGHEQVRRVIVREIVVQVIDAGSSDLLAARPLINSLVEAAIATPQFRSVVAAAARNAHRLLFDRGGNVAFDIADAGTVVLSALRTLAPNVASKVPRNVDATLLDLRRRSFAVRALRVADKIRLLGITLPLLGLALLTLAIAIARRRRAAVTRCAIILSIAAAAAFADLLLVRHSLLVNLFGGDELSNAEVREAAGALWQSYVGDLVRWAAAIALAALIVAAASADLLRLYSARAGLEWVRARLEARREGGARALLGALALALGALLLVDPTDGLKVVAVTAGALLFYFGSAEVLAALGAPPERPRRSLSRASSRSVAALAGLGVLVGAPAVALADGGNTDGAPYRPAIGTAQTCNGYAQLCARRIDEVAFAGTHNAMSAADSPGWFIANQSRGIARQLDDGIRAFKISTHYGIGRPGNVRTDIAAAGEKVNRVSEKLSAPARAALQRVSRSVGFGPRAGKREVWLCHTLCELGATRAVSFFSTIRRFLQLNPNQVVILFDEDYVSEDSLEKVFKQSGLYPHLATLRAGQQMPTLGELVRSQHNVLVFTQEPVSGRHPWDMYGFGGFIQDTPLGAVKPGQFSCKPSRGTPDSPLLMMNDWADVFPPRRSPNVALTQRDFIVNRGRQCLAERHHIPNLILTDFYDSGNVAGAARVLNGLGDQKPAPIVAVAGRAG